MTSNQLIINGSKVSDNYLDIGISKLQTGDILGALEALYKASIVAPYVVKENPTVYNFLKQISDNNSKIEHRENTTKGSESIYYQAYKKKVHGLSEREIIQKIIKEELKNKLPLYQTVSVADKKKIIEIFEEKYNKKLSDSALRVYLGKLGYSKMRNGE